MPKQLVSKPCRRCGQPVDKIRRSDDSCSYRWCNYQRYARVKATCSMVSVSWTYFVLISRKVFIFTARLFSRVKYSAFKLSISALYLSTLPCMVSTFCRVWIASSQLRVLNTRKKSRKTIIPAFTHLIPLRKSL